MAQITHSSPHANLQVKDQTGQATCFNCVIETYQTQAYNLARRMELTRPGQRMDTDAAKLFSATMAKNVADRAMQVLGGYGYVGESTVERLWRAAKLIEIGGGTLEAHHKNICRDLARHPDTLRA